VQARTGKAACIRTRGTDAVARLALTVDTHSLRRSMNIHPIPMAVSEVLLALNNAHATELSSLDKQGLIALINHAFYARQAGDMEAVLIALDQDHPTYSSPNYLWFRAHYSRFVYVDRIVVAVGGRGKGHARKLYTDLIAHAAAAGHDRIVCEINSEPPNPASDALHTSVGFRQVGSASIYGGAKTVRYMELLLTPRGE
jgi:uncharacterized protein